MGLSAGTLNSCTVTFWIQCCGIYFVKWYCFGNCLHFYPWRQTEVKATSWLQNDPLDRSLSNQLVGLTAGPISGCWRGIAMAACPVSFGLDTHVFGTCIHGLLLDSVELSQPFFYFNVIYFQSPSQLQGSFWSCFMETGGHWWRPVCTGFFFGGAVSNSVYWM